VGEEQRHEKFQVYQCVYIWSPCGVMVSMLAVGPKVRGLKPDGGDGFLRAIKIHSTTSFRGEVKLSALCYKILLHSKELYEYERIIL
jgi:hypothetical protein